MVKTADHDRLARMILGPCLRVTPGERVWIQSWDHTLDVAEALALECSLRGNPHLLTVRYEDAWLSSFLTGPKRRPETVTEAEAATLAHTDAFIYTLGPRSPIPWNAIPEGRRKDVSVWLDRRYDRSRRAERWASLARRARVRMLGLEATLATPERARALGLDHAEWCREMLRGCLTDPLKMARKGDALDRLLRGEGRVTITSAAGTNLQVELANRRTSISNGIASEEKARRGMVTFLPAGAIEVSVSEDSANGTIVYDEPVLSGRSRIVGLRVRVRDGEVVRHGASRGDAHFGRYLQEGGADAARFSFIGFGLNPNLRHGFTQDDKVLGGVTLGFGDNGTKGGRNQANGEWWASIAHATVNIDALQVMRHGRLLV